LSYALTLKVDKGFISLEDVGGKVPEGIFEITGHKDDSTEMLGIHRREPDGRYAGGLSHTHPVRPAPVPEPPEGGF
jgi:hypothetical protein